MDERPPQRQEAVAHAFVDAETARRFQRRLHEVRGYHQRVKVPSGIQYDESGYPLPSDAPGLAGRIRRLITG